jgi:redox-sensitive bicupin YhaK (pirin superfamily)
MDRRDVLKGAAAAAAAGFLLPSVSMAEPAGTSAPLGVRRSHERGHANHGWLDSRFTFSFAGYHDPRWMGFRALRVINEDFIEAGAGFPLHPHQDMEIVTYVLEGALEHKDTLGNGSVIRPGEVQQMSAGRGIQHSEFNPSREGRTHLLQIWILPDRRGVAPRYAQEVHSVQSRTNTLKLVASKAGGPGVIPIHQDTNLRAGILEPGTALAWRNPEGRHVWIQVARGSLDVNGQTLAQGDAAWTSRAGDLTLSPRTRAEILLFDLA